MLADVIRSVLAPETTDWIRGKLPFIKKDLNVQKNLIYLKTLKAIDDAGLDRSVAKHLEADANTFQHMVEYLETAHIDAELGFVSSANTQLEMNWEAKAKAEAAELELQKTLSTLGEGLLGDHEIKKMLASQQKWEEYRKAEADFEASRYEGGSMAPLAYWSSYREATIARRAELLPLFEER
jgi:uncharacterized protein YecT (DUF1311 family)